MKFPSFPVASRIGMDGVLYAAGIGPRTFYNPVLPAGILPETNDTENGQDQRCQYQYVPFHLEPPSWKSMKRHKGRP